MDKALSGSQSAEASSNSFTDLPPIIGADRCAALLQCSKQQVELLADNGTLPAIKFGRGWIFVTSQLIARVAELCDQNRRTPETAAGPEPIATAGSLTSEMPAPAASPVSRASRRSAVQRPARKPGRPRLSFTLPE